VAPSDERDQDLPNHAPLPDDRFRQLSLEPPGNLGYALEGYRGLRVGETKGPIGHNGERRRVYYVPIGSSFKVQGSGFMVQGSGFRVQGAGFNFGVQGSSAPRGLVFANSEP
jgi:hypothetical protein